MDDQPFEFAYSDFISLDSLAELDSANALKQIAHAVDYASDIHDLEGLYKITSDLAPSIDPNALSSVDEIYLNFYLANAWSSIKHETSMDLSSAWAWDSQPILNEIIHLRRALACKDLSKIGDVQISRIRTNLGNCYSNIGRTIEAISEWELSSHAIPFFGMALCNQGLGFKTYAMHMHIPEIQYILLHFATSRTNPKDKVGLEPGAEESYQIEHSNLLELDPLFAKPLKIDLDSSSLGSSKSEKEYRSWCLHSRLFLNPINDIGPYPYAARDTLTCPPMVLPLGEKPDLQACLNLVKQEYCSARYNLYLGINDNGCHFSDKHTCLINTLDYPCYGLRYEMLKMAYRSMYSIFDKIAYFLNEYLQLGHSRNAVSFRKIWYNRGLPNRGIHDDLKIKPNLPLRGLFWLSKDLFEKNSDFSDVADPLAQRMSEVRNFLEHKFLHLRESNSRGQSSDDARPLEPISITELEQLTLHLASLVRSSIIYLILGVHSEERARASTRDKNSIIPPMLLDNWEDAWKR